MSRHTGVTRTAFAAGVAVLLSTMGACGVSASAPEDHGDRLQAVAPFGDDVKPAPQPNEASQPDTLVRAFLKASVGGGEPAIRQVMAFLSTKAQNAWTVPANPQIAQPTVVRIVGGPTNGVALDGRTPVTVDYVVVGQLTDQGRIDELSQALNTVATMTFWVRADEENQRNLRIDQIDNSPGGLLLSDEALDEIYRIQPVYFWDAKYSLLVPDLRYLPLTLPEEQRANKLVQWLFGGPSPWLTGAQRIPAGINTEPVVISGDAILVVNLNADASALDPQGRARLYHQLQWSLSNGSATRRVELQIAGQAQQIGAPDDFRRANRSWTFGDGRPRYDIVDQKVVPTSGAAAPEILGSADNEDVVWASVNRDRTLAALVRRNSDGRSYLQIVRTGGAAPVISSLPPRADMSRPSWVPVPGSNDEYVMLASGGRLHLVSTTDGSVDDVTPSRVGGVTKATVSPDGRRVAFIAGGEAYVASITAEGETLTVGSIPRPILGSQVAASGIAWINETWLYVGGSPQGAPAMWRVSADGVVAHNESANLRGINVTDVVASPVWPTGRPAEVIVYTAQGQYAFGTGPITQTDLQSPFFGG